MTVAIGDSCPDHPSGSQTGGKGVKKRRINYVTHPLAALVGLAGLGILGFLAYKVATVQQSPPNTGRWYGPDACSQSTTQCPRTGYKQAPLVVISFDGFRRDYLEQPGWAPWLRKAAECGVTTEKVFPVYPSKTFPNHYSQVTGLYPKYHGIVDNAFWDPEISAERRVQSLKGATKEYFKGIPIWEHYMKSGGRAHCYFWVGSEQRPCTVTMQYNGSVPFGERFAKVREWLNLPEGERPGLIHAYFQEPDATGHHETKDGFLGSKKLRAKVREMDGHFHDFLQGLYEDGLLNCVNVLLMSDHGLAQVKKLVYLDQFIENGTILAPGPVGRFYSDRKDQLLKELSSSCPTDYTVTTDHSRPPRYHHSGSPRIGDILLGGRLGVSLELQNGRVFKDTGSHGWDYLHRQLHAIFVARGPAFKPGVVLPPFQQIEYFNLFLELLGLHISSYRSNGTAGIFDPALRRPQPKEEEKAAEIQSSLDPPSFQSCCLGGQVCEMAPPVEVFSTTLNHTSWTGKDFCGERVYGIDGTTVAVLETVSAPTKLPSDCWNCTDINGHLSLSTDHSVSVPLTVTGPFMTTVFSALQQFQEELLLAVGKFHLVSGTAVDRDYDVIADRDQSSPPIHFYRLYLYCLDRDVVNSMQICSSPSKLRSMAYIFPIMERDLNCMDPETLLLYYSTRLKDVEAISGLRLNLDGFSAHQKAALRTRIMENLDP